MLITIIVYVKIIKKNPIDIYRETIGNTKEMTKILLHFKQYFNCDIFLLLLLL